MTTAITPPSPLAGIVCIIVGVLCLTLSDATAKWLGPHYPPLQILFLRALIALPFVTLFILNLGGRRTLYTRHFKLHLLRGSLNTLSATCFYIGLGLLPLAEVTAVAFAAPLVVTTLSVFVLKEHVDLTRWIAVLMGFAGVLVIVRPGLDSFQPAALWPIATAVLYAVIMITARAIGNDESMLTTMFYIVLGQLMCTAVFLPWAWQPLHLVDLPFFAGVALFSTLGLTFLTWAFRIAPASVVAPFDYTGLLWATLLGWLIWRERPDMYTYCGACMIVVSGLYIAWRQTMQRHRHRRPDSGGHP